MCHTETPKSSHNMNSKNILEIKIDKKTSIPKLLSTLLKLNFMKQYQL